MKLRRINTIALLLVAAFSLTSCETISSIVPNSISDPVYFGTPPETETVGPDRNKTLKNQIMNESY